MRGPSLRLKINRAIFVAFLAAMAILATVLALFLKFRTTTIVDRTGVLYAALVAPRLPPLAAMLEAGQAGSDAGPLLQGLAGEPDVMGIGLYTAAGERLAAAGQNQPPGHLVVSRETLPEARRVTPIRVGGVSAVSLIEPVRATDGRAVGFLRLDYSLALLQTMTRLVWVLLVLTLAGAYGFMTLLLNLLLGRMVLRPVDALRQGLEAVAAGRLGQAVPVPAEEPLGRMVAAFNAMSARLKETSDSLTASQAELRAERRLLEERVEARTAELAEANEKLRREIEVRRSVEAQRKELLVLYRAILESTAEAVLCVAKDKSLMACNRRFLDLWGLPETWTGIRDNAERYEHLARRVRDPAAAAKRAEALLVDEHAVVTDLVELADGRVFERRSGPIRQGATFWGRVFSYVDITDRRQAEASLRQALAQRDAVVENTQIGLVMTHDRVLTEINTRGAAIFGYAREDLLGRSASVLHAHRLDFESMAEALETELAAQGSVSDEQEIRRGDGSMVWIRLRGKAVDAADMSQGVVWAFDDITREKDRQARLEQAKADAEDASRAKGVFLAVMSHEIRTPLNAIMGLTEDLLSGQATPEQRRHLGMVRDSAVHLLGIVDDILDFSKIEAGKLVLADADFNSRELLEAATRTIAVQARRKGLEFRAAVDPAVPEVLRGDPGRLRQVLLNVLGNAVKFTESGLVSLEVSPDRSRPQDGSLGIMVRVADTGIGIAPEQVPELFRSFQQASGTIARRFGGTGLAISKEIVERMGGHIEVGPNPGGGSIFSFTVFLQPGDPAKVAAPAPEPASGRTTPTSGRRLHILLVEDNALNAAVTRLHLGRMGHDLTAASSARDAYQLLGRQPFDVVLMDIEMPDIDGITASRTIRAGGEPGAPVLDADIPIVAVTAHAVEEVRQQCLEAGMDGFVTKPVNYKALEATLDAMSRGRDAPVPGPVPDKPAALFDPDTARAGMGITWTQYRDVSRASFAEGSQRLAEARQAVANAEFGRAAIAAHTFKGAAATLGAYQCRELAVAWEKAVRDQDAAASRDLGAKAAAAWEAVGEALESWRKPGD